MEESRGLQFPQRSNNDRKLNLSSHIAIEQKIRNCGDVYSLCESTICTAWALLVYQYIGETDVQFGVSLAEEAPAVHPLKVQLSNDDDALAKVHLNVQTELGNVANKARECNGDGSGLLEQHQVSQTNTVFLFRERHSRTSFDANNEDLNNDGLISNRVYAHGAALLIECSFENSTVWLKASYDASAISDARMSRILRHFETTITRLLAANESADVKSLGGCTIADRLEIEKVNSGIKPPVDDLFHHFFSRGVRSRPDAEAVCSFDGNLTYKDLDNESEKLAQELRRRGVGPNSIVPLRFQKTKYAIVAMLAVSKAGGAFISLDLTAPPARMNALLQHATVDFLVTASFVKTPSGLSVRHTLHIDQSYGTVPPEEQSTVDGRKGSSSDLLYIIFTSGSTGKPKAVAITHTAFCSSASNYSNAMLMDSTSRVFQFSSYTFDGCILEILTALMVGGCVCVPSEAERMNDVAGTMERLRVNWAVLTPTVTRLLDPQSVPTLETIVLAGEATQERDLSRWESDVNPKNVLICYGPSECAVLSTVAHVDPKKPLPTELGHPTGCAIWIVDETDPNILLPFGAEGELLIEGPNVGYGYLNSPEQTARAWIDAPSWAQNPASTACRGRWYRSGDICKYADNGSLHFVRRKDSQIKLRGQRISMHEFEMALKKALPKFVVAGEVIKYENEDIDRSLLVAFAAPMSSTAERLEILSDQQYETQIAKARKQMMDSLPIYMVPSEIICISIMPLTSSGKTDRLRLRSLAAEKSLSQNPDSQLRSPKVNLATKTEARLRALWARALNLPESMISIQGHFLRLGADSITAMRLVSLARSEGLPLTVADIFSHPLLADLAQRVDGSGSVTNSELAGPEPFALIRDSNDLLSDICDQYQLNRDTIEDVLPCTPLQEGLMILSIRDSGTYIGEEMYELPSNINTESFMRAWAAVYADTPIWRSRVVQAKGRIYQVVIKEELQWLQGLDFDRRWKEGASTSMSFGDRLTDFGLRLDQASNVWQFHFRAHHSLYDAWTMSLTFEQVHRSYCGNPLTQLLPMSSVVRQLAVDDRAASEFWSSYLEGVNTKPFPAAGISLGGVRSDDSLALTLQCTIPVDSQWTANTLVKAAWAIVANQYTACDDIVFGTPLSGRNAAVNGIDLVCAPTLATVPIRAHMERTQSIHDFLERLQTEAVSMIPFEQTGLQHIQQYNEDTRLACQFTCLLLLQTAMPPAYDFSSVFGVRRIAESAAKTNSYALTIDLSPVDGGFEVLVGYDTRSMVYTEVEMILRQLEHVLNLLTTVDESTPLSALQSLHPQQLATLSSWNRLTAAPLQDQCAHDLFRQQVINQPDAIAVASCDEGDITYQRLDELSDWLSLSLVEQGVEQGSMVALVFEKSLFAIVGMLGVLKAGGALLCMDPQVPNERAASMCSQADPCLGLTSAQYEDFFHGLVTRSMIVSHKTLSPSKGRLHTTSRVTGSTRSSNVMYTVFTSGSTGGPKGCVIEHGAYVTAAKGVAMAHGLHSGTRLLQYSNYAYDVSVEDIFTTLSVGGCVCVASQDELQNDLTQAIVKYGVTQTTLTPTVANLIDFDTVPSLQTVVVFGESASKLRVPKISNVHFINSYGCSETAITNIVAGNMFERGANNIGFPVACSAWIVDVTNSDILLPIGAEGELLISGPVLAREYLQDQEKTNTSFIKAPIWTHVTGSDASACDRFYKTGDLARFSPDGSIVHLGRKDHQVKFHGLRIELQEIEAHVESAAPDYTNIVDVVERETPGIAPKTALLVAFLSHKSAGDGSEQIHHNPSVDGSDVASSSVAHRILHSDAIAAVHSELKAKLSQTLPLNMVPTLYVTVDEMPLGTSGKVDRRQLKQLVESLSPDAFARLNKAGDNIVPPKDTTERRLKNAWAELLGIPTASIGRNSHFFHLGGDSLAAITLVSSMRKDGYSVAVSDIFKTPVLSELAKLCTVTRRSRVHPAQPFSLVSDPVGLSQSVSAQMHLSSGAVDDIYPCTPLQEGMLSLSQKSEGTYTGRAVYRLPKGIDLDRFRSSWELFVRMAPIWRTAICQAADGRFLQVVLNRPLVWPIVNDLKLYLEQDKTKMMSLGDVLSRIALVDERPRSGLLYLVLTLHHAAADAWSLNLALEAVTRLYDAQSIDALTPFSSFIKYTRASRPAVSKRYWRNYLEDFTGSHFPRSVHGLNRERRLCEVELFSEHIMSASKEYTPTTLLRAAWATLVFNYTGQLDSVFGVTISGRNADMEGIERCIGPTLGTVPFRVRFQRELAVRDLLRSVQADSTDMIPFEHLGLQNIARVSTAGKAACAFSSLVVYQADADDSSFEHVMGEAVMADSNIPNTSQALLLECSPSKMGHTFRLTFDEAIVSMPRANRMLRETERIFIALDTCDGTCQMSCLRQCGPDDKAEIRSWNSKTMVPSSTLLLQDLIARSVEKSPDAIAIDSWDGQLSYAQLFTLAQRLSVKLQDLGIGRNNIVPLRIARSKYQVISMLGVAMTGAAFVAMDLSMPAARVEFILAQVEADLMLTTSTTPRFNGYPVKDISVDQLIECQSRDFDMVVAPQKRRYKETRHSQEQPLCLLYTSGSTGNPKGVMLSHQDFSSVVNGHCEATGLSATSRVLNFSAANFDATLFELFTTLVAGGCCCIPTEDERSNAFVAFMERLEVTLAWITPSVARLLQNCHPASLDTLVLIGEPCSQQDIDMHRNVPNVLVGFGPSETSIVTNFAYGDTLAPLALGRAFGCSVWVVDPEDADILLPVGSEGELIIQGPGVSSFGYLNESEKSRSVFIDPPRWAHGLAIGEQRFYRTGDITYQKDDGSVQFVGRKDDQVKIRGQRVEMGEVESALRRALPGFDVAAQVVACITPSGTTAPTLTAFISFATNTGRQTFIKGGSNGETQKSVTIKLGETESCVKVLPISTILDKVAPCIHALSMSLPGYMIPSLFVPLSRMPLTISGKVDRVRLRCTIADMPADQIQKLSQASAERDIPVQTTQERALQSLWARTLKVPAKEIAANHSFLGMGGDSISAMRLVTFARQDGYSLRVADVFGAPILSNLARRLHHLNTLEVHTQSQPFDLLPGGPEAVEDIGRKLGVRSTLIEDAYPCTAIQEGLMSLSIRDGSYVSNEIYALSSTIDPARVMEAWKRIVAMLPIWRTRIVVANDGSMLQVVLTEELDWHIAEISDIRRYRHDSPLPPMGPLQRLSHFTLLREPSSGTAYVSIAAHHAIYDALSLQDSLQKVCEAYHSKELSPSSPFKSFIAHLNNSAMRSTASLGFWSSYFAGIDTAQFPPPVATDLHNGCNKTLRRALGDSPKSRSGITPFTLVKAAWAVLIRQFTSCNDVSFGATLNGRNTPLQGIEHIAGPTMTTVPLRIVLNLSQSVEDLLEQVQTDAVAMIPYEQTGLQNIQNINEECRKGCQFNTLIVFQATAGQPSQSDIFSDPVFPVVDDDRFNSYALTLELATDSSGFHAVACYDTSVLSESQMERILMRFKQLLQEFGNAEGQVTVRQLMQVDAGDIQKMPSSASQASDDKAFHISCIHDEFVEVSRRQPHAIAIDAWDGQQTYENLDRDSSAAANLMADSGLCVGSIIPICFERSVWMIVAMLAVLKAGGAFVSIDPRTPHERLKNICTQIGAKVGLVSAAHSSFFNHYDLRSFVVDRTSCAGNPGIANSPCHTKSDDLAYVIFTSGSTGVPKGVAIEHGAYMCNAFAVASALGMSGATRTLHFAASTFDTAIEEIFTTLLTGGCVCVPSDAERNNDPGRSIAKYNVTFADLTPSVAALIDYSLTPTLRTLVLGGEMATSTMEQCNQHGITVKNSWGLTESAITNTVASDITHGGPANIGKPVGCAIWIVDAEDPDLLAPIGAEGEMLIEGRCLARGYLNDRVKTDESFITDPAWAVSGSRGPNCRRFFKTGDLARCQEDGSLIYAKRKDSQVKLRGLRIELGEVEAQICTVLPNYQAIAGVVKGVGSEKGVDFLAAFLAPRRALPTGTMDSRLPGVAIILPASTLQGARRALDERLPRYLPAYMIPSALIPVSHIPLTSSGKVDRRRLKALAESMPASQALDILQQSSIKVVPESSLEIRMQSMWAKVLGVRAETIGRHDHFFHHGGDSIRGMHLVAVARAGGIDVSVAQLFKHPLLNELCDSIQNTIPTQTNGFQPKAENETSRPHEAVIRTMLPGVSIEKILVATDLQALAIYEHSKGNGGFVAYLTILYDRKMDYNVVCGCFERAIERNEILRTVFVPVNKRTYQVILGHYACPLQQSATTLNVAEYCKSLILEDQHTRLEPGQLPFKLWFVNGSEHDSVVMRLSHAQYDGISLPILLGELQDHDSMSTTGHGRAHQMSYLVQALDAMPQSSSINFWSKLLHGSSISRIPTKSVPQGRTLTAAWATCSIPSPEPAKSDFTFATRLKAAWAMTLSKLTGVIDITFGHLVSGRTLPLAGIEKVNGPCINLIPIRVKTDQQLAVVLAHVYQQQIDAMPHEHLGFETIFRKCTTWPAPPEGQPPRFSTIVQHQNLHNSTETMSLHGAECKLSLEATWANVTDAWVISEPEGDEVRIQIGYFEEILDGSLVQRLLDDLCRVLKDIDVTSMTSIESMAVQFAIDTAD